MIRLVSCFLGALSVLVAACGPKLGGDGDGIGTTGASGTSTGGSETGTPTGGVTSEPGTNSTSALSGVSSSSGDGGCGFGCLPDLPEGHCNPYAEDCPEGEKCGVAWPDGDPDPLFGVPVNRCVPVTGDGQPGETCTNLDVASGVDDCAKGAICLTKCVARCVGSFDSPMCSDDDYECYWDQDGVLDLCVFVCDPLLQDCPTPTDVCYPVNADFVCAADVSGDQGQANDTCEFINGCDKGLACIDPAAASAACGPQSSGCCQPFCKFPDAPCPNLDQVCVQWFEPMDFPPGDPRLEIGICALPQ